MPSEVDQNLQAAVEPMLIDRSGQLEEVLRAVESASEVSIDIESNGYYNYYERTCILSLSTPEHNYVIDSLSLWDEMSPLRDLLCDGSRRVLVHGGSYDVISLKRDFDFTFPNVMDSLLAAQLLGFEILGLAGLVKMRLGHELPKELQRHNWTMRPLEPLQLTYLANDTRFLFEIVAHLESLIKEKDLTEELSLECDALSATEYVEKVYSSDESVNKLKDARRMNPQVRGYLRSIFEWREDVARELDLAPFRVLGNGTIISLAKNPPANTDELRDRRGLGRHVYDAGLDNLMEAIKAGADSPFPYTRKKGPRPAHRRNYDETRNLTKAIKAWRNDEADARGIGIQGVLPTSALKTIADLLPTSMVELLTVERFGQRRADRYGSILLKLVQEYCPASLAQKASSS